MSLFRQEAHSLQQLGNHPQIPRIIDFFEEENNFFLVQEFIEGKNFRQELSNTKHFDQSQIIKLLTDVLEVLNFIHESGNIHRDIKPSNLIRNRFDGRFFIIDFGTVKEKINPKNRRGKDQPSTVQLACKLLRTVPKSLIKGRTVIVQADTEFGTIEFLNAVRQKSWRAVVGIRCNRKLKDGRRLKDLYRHAKRGLLVQLKDIDYPLTLSWFWLKRADGKREL